MAENNIYLDNNGTGSGTINDPYGAFSEINWTTGGAYSIYDMVASGGDVYINLKKGRVWRETLTIGTSGVPGHPITIQSYGTSGGNPIMCGSDIIDGNWSEDGKHEFYDNSIDTEVESVFVDGVEWFEGTAGTLNSDEWDWTTSAGGTLFLGSDPSGKVIEASQRLSGINLTKMDYIVLDGLQTQHAKGAGIQFWNGCDYNIVQNCTATKNRDVGISLHGSGKQNRYNTIQDNIVTYNGEVGIQISEYCDNNLVRRNKVSFNGINPAEASESGIKLWGNQGTTHHNNTIVRRIR